MRFVPRGAFASLFFLAACSSSSSEVAKPGPTAPPGDPPGEAPAPCDDGTYRVSSGACEAFPKLEVTRSPTTITPARDHHTTMVIETSSGMWLYVIGGTDSWETMHSDVRRARIAEDGSLGEFEEAGKLPEPRAGHCMVQVKDRLYLFGGVVGGNRAGPSKSSVVLQLDAEGKVVSSSAGPEMPIAVMHLTCNLVNDSVYVLGGRGERGSSTKLSARTRIGVDGVASPFENETPLSPDRSHHASFVKDKRLYILGGITGEDPSPTLVDRKDIAYATIGDDGKLGDWTAAGALPKALSVSSAQLYKDAVYIFGGLENGSMFTDKIRRATFENGELGAFTTLPVKLPAPRGHVHNTPTWKQFIYSVGGKDAAERSIDAIDIGRFE